VTRITVNGREREMPPGATVATLIEELALANRRVAVERNRAIVRKEDWERTRVEDGDTFEILHFVGGGRD
jgi:thiamine biosynthesis protein ThiS